MQATALRRGSGADSGSTAARGEGRALALAAALPACSRDSATAPATAQESSDHMLFLDGVYLFRGAHPPLFHPVAGPSANELQRLVEQIAVQVCQVLERRGLIERDIENAWLATDFEAGPLDDLIGYSITYRIAVGPKAGQRLFTMQTVPPRLPGLELDPNGAARAGGFSLHAGVDIAPHQCDKLKRLCRYISRPPVTSERLALTASGQVRYTLKTPYRDGTTHIVLEPLDLMARLAALVPPPRRRLTRFHGVFAPHSPLRAMVTPARWGRGAQPSLVEPGKPPTPRQVAMYWATRLKRVFRIEIDTCQHCGAWPMSWNGWRRSGWPNQPAASIIHWVAEDSPR